MMNKVKKYLLFFLGTLIFAFGISLGNRSLFGGNPMSITVVGLQKQIHLSMGTCNLLVSLVEIIVGSLLDRSNTTIISLITMFVSSYAIDFANLFIRETNVLTIRIVYMLLGIVCYCAGLGLQQVCKIGYSNLDIFIFGFKKLFKVEKYRTIRWPIDICFIIIGILLKAEVSIGTIILMLCSGTLIEKFNELFRKIIKVE